MVEKEKKVLNAEDWNLMQRIKEWDDEQTYRYIKRIWTCVLSIIILSIVLVVVTIIIMSPAFCDNDNCQSQVDIGNQNYDAAQSLGKYLCEEVEKDGFYKVNRRGDYLFVHCSNKIIKLPYIEDI